MPNDTVISVRGSSMSRQQPELATVHLAVAAEGADKADVYRRTADAAGALVATIRQLADAPGGPATLWSSDRLHTWFERPWDQNGRQLDAVHHARAQARVTFQDLEALGGFLDDVGTRDGVTVDQLSWALTDEHERDTARDVRRRAVLDAVERARDYADAAGFGDVTVVAIADVGLLDEPGAGRRMKSVHDGASALGFAGGPLSFSPEDIVVSAEVDARFVAS